MRHPICDDYSDTPGYLHWFRDCVYPVRSLDAGNHTPVEDPQDTELISEFHCQLFHLNHSEDLKKYKIVSQRILDGWYSLLNLQRNWDESTGGMCIWMEWTQDYLEVKNGLR